MASTRQRRPAAPAADASAPPPPPRVAADPTRLLALAAFAAALLLRLWNLGWGLPNAQRLFSFHPDESMVVSASLQVNPFLLLLDPGLYAYGALPMLLNGAVIHLGEAVGLVGPGPSPGVPSAGALLAARLVSAVLGAATCFFLYGTGRLLFGRAAGLIAAALYALAPLAVQHGHFATVDVPATFFVAGTLYFAARAASPEARPRDLLWAGVWSGLAAAAKYNAGLVLLAGVAAWWLTGRDRKGLVFLLLGALGAFLVGCPTVLLNPGGVLQAIRDESRHVSTGHGDVFTGTAPGLIYHVAFNLRWGLTGPLMALTLAGVIAIALRRGRGDGILAAFALPYYLLIGLAAVKFARYTLPLYPPLLLWVGALLPASAARWRRPALTAFGVVFGAASIWALLFSCALVRTMGGPDPRDQAAAYLRSLPNVRTVGFAKGPWFFSPTLAPTLTHPIPPAAQTGAAQAADPALIPAGRKGPDGKPQPVEWDTALLRETAPDAIALSEFEYADAQRARVPKGMEYIGAVEAAYPTRRVFARPAEVFGIRFTKLDTARGLPTQNLPEDMRYTNPTEVVFTK
jgi:hypothetical protein